MSKSEAAVNKSTVRISVQKKFKKIYIAPGILKRIGAQTHGVTRW